MRIDNEPDPPIDPDPIPIDIPEPNIPPDPTPGMPDPRRPDEPLPGPTTPPSAPTAKGQ